MNYIDMYFYYIFLLGQKTGFEDFEVYKYGLTLHHVSITGNSRNISVRSMTPTLMIDFHIIMK